MSGALARYVGGIYTLYGSYIFTRLVRKYFLACVCVCVCTSLCSRVSIVPLFVRHVCCVCVSRESINNNVGEKITVD